MLQFLKYVLATIVGSFIFFFLFFFILIGIGSAISTRDVVKVEPNSVLKLTFDKPIVERSVDNPFSELDVPFAPNSTIGLIQLRDAIANAKVDDNIRGIYLETGLLLNAGYATLEEIRQSLIDFKESGKFVMAFGEIYTEKGYYLASVADSIYLHPIGALEFNGLNSEAIFLKGTLEKLDIKPHVFRVGDYKSAVEPFLLDKMSEASREQTSAYLNAMNNHSLESVAQARNIPQAELKRVQDSLLIREPEDALRYKLVTHLGYYDQLMADIRKKLDIDEDKKINFISLSKYEKAEKKIKQGSFDNRIAVIVASGEIRGGEGSEDVIGSTKIAEALRKARLDKKVKAVVLRINSPGGDALASDVIWREVTELKKVKPIIASMSDLAASGGYYMAMGCDTIVAHPNTITGSIGIFGVLFNIQGFLENKLGVTVDNVKTSKYADIGMPTRSLTEFERQVIQKQVERGYEVFTSKAAEGRNLSLDSLKKIASGRVWSGAEAKQIGLVDVFGGLEDAIKLAARAANVEDDYRVRYLPEQKTFVEQLFGGMSDEIQAKAMERQFGTMVPYIEAFQKVKSWEGIQARLPFEIAIQ